MLILDDHLIQLTPMFLLQSNNTDTAVIISGIITLIVALVGLFGNWYLANQNKKQELLIKQKEIEQKEYQFLLENLKSFWEYQNKLYAETLKVVSELVLNEDIASPEFLNAYKRFWVLYWSELPTCESKEVEAAMVNIKDLIYDKKHLDKNNKASIDNIKHQMKVPLLQLSLAVKQSSVLLEYSERLKNKIRSKMD